MPSLVSGILTGCSTRTGVGPNADALDRFLVFHGGSGSTKEEIKEAVNNGVVKMNVDTDTQVSDLTRSTSPPRTHGRGHEHSSQLEDANMALGTSLTLVVVGLPLWSPRLCPQEEGLPHDPGR